MAIVDDISVAVNGDIRYTGDDSGGTGGNYTVLELHRFLGNLMDDQEATPDDFVDITTPTTGERATDNIISLNAPFNIDDELAQHLYDGSVTQDGGNERYSGLIVVGTLAGTTTLQIVQNDMLYDGDSPFWGTGLNPDAGQNILMRCLVKTRTGGVDIDGGRIRVTAREWGHSYAEFGVTMGLGNSTAAIFTNPDLNNQTAQGTVATWSDIVNIEGYQLIDLNNGNGDRPYYSQWDMGSRSVNQLYERAKWLTVRGTSQVVHNKDGELFRGITHEWDYDNNPSGEVFATNDVLSWGSGSTAGTGLLLAIDDNAGTGTMWIQLLTGTFPTDGMQISNDASSPATCDVDGSVTSRSLPTSGVFIGVSTGTAIQGGFGIGIDSDDLSVNDQLIDLTDTPQQPPNNVTFTVYGLVTGEDRVLATNAQGVTIDYDQMTLATALTGVSETSVVVNTDSSGVGIPADTPQTGIIRVLTDAGIYRYVPFTAHDSVDTFTIDAIDFSGDNASASNNVFIAYIDKLATSDEESFTYVYDEDRTIFVRVRDGGATPTKTYETTAPMGTGGGSATVNRISDA